MAQTLKKNIWCPGETAIGLLRFPKEGPGYLKASRHKVYAPSNMGCVLTIYTDLTLNLYKPFDIFIRLLASKPGIR
jgi:hypothetical protein